MRTDGQTDRHCDCNSRVLQFCDLARKPKNCKFLSSKILGTISTCSLRVSKLGLKYPEILFI
jgi:hypothetical protein